MSRRILPDHVLHLILCHCEISQLEKIKEAFPDLVDRNLHVSIIRNFLQEAEKSEDLLTKVVSGFCECILNHVQSSSLW
ncbi:Hypothetical protein ZAZAV_318 [Cedratvirus Zaza IHUMI]|uniref:Uncharacterized protein n=1 Tax=Cedratvirus Zaza IHUMI TaxID=2126979 RepID=A0A2R8FEM8_9VIRU|nr:Hypothetical protein ZAZAV_318 [Cedratvirus Zaza IHUMI]